ncbi:MAG: flagellar basal body L-ring protein FlgH [Gammaproteobacteria bacterium]
MRGCVRISNQTHLSLLLLAPLAGLTACNSMPRRDPAFAPSFPAPLEVTQQQQASSGSIYQAGYDVVLFEDARARRVGDILTIRLVESTNATKASSNDISKTQSATIDNPTILGASPQFGLPGILPLDVTENNTFETNLGSEHAFNGESATAQRNSLSGDITVTIADVLPNGNLLVRGEKRLNLNAGNEYVKISGLVRPLDIQANNTVLSTKVADATIVYNGDGAEADASKIGWLARFFVSALLPF